MTSELDRVFFSEKRIYFLIWVACVIGAWLIVPYIYDLQILNESLSATSFFVFATLQAVVIYTIVICFSYLLVKKTDLLPFQKLSKQNAVIASIAGGAAGLVLVILDKTVFYDSKLANTLPPTLWTRIFASVYGGINEEVLLRLFLFTTVYFFITKTLKEAKTKRDHRLWAVNILMALLFGIGHMPAAFKLTSPTFFEVSRILLLNGMGGVVFGWLYFSRGLWAAMVAHFAADLMVHVFVI